MVFGQTHTIRPKDLNNLASIVASQAWGERPHTPLEPSPTEPDLSRSSGSSSWHRHLPPATRLSGLEFHPKSVLRVTDEMGLLDQSTMESRKGLILAEEKLVLRFVYHNMV